MYLLESIIQIKKMQFKILCKIIRIKILLIREYLSVKILLYDFM